MTFIPAHLQHAQNASSSNLSNRYVNFRSLLSGSATRRHEKTYWRTFCTTTTRSHVTDKLEKPRCLHSEVSAETRDAGISRYFRTRLFVAHRSSGSVNFPGHGHRIVAVHIVHLDPCPAQLLLSEPELAKSTNPVYTSIYP